MRVPGKTLCYTACLTVALFCIVPLPVLANPQDSTNDATTAAQAGLGGMVAPNAVNNGIITARVGRARLASGDTTTMDLYGDNLMQVAVSDHVKSQLMANNKMVDTGNGNVALTAAAGKDIVSSLIAVPGEVKAPAVAQANGEITIYASNSNAAPDTVTASDKAPATNIVVATKPMETPSYWDSKWNDIWQLSPAR